MTDFTRRRELPRGGVSIDVATRGNRQLPAAPHSEPIPKSAQIPPYWLYKPPEGIDFYMNETGVLAAGAGSTLILASVPAIFLTPNYEGATQSVAIFVDAPTTDIDVTWTLRFREAPVPGWDRLTTFPRSATNLSIEFPGIVQCGPGTKIDVLVTNNNAFGPWTVGAEVTGWSWPRISRQRVFGREGT